MNNKSQIMRTCSACGLQKPLAAFLEISQKQGTHYGTICVTCRSAGVTGTKEQAKEDQGTVITTGNRIGLKERIFIEKEQQKKIQTEKEEKKEHILKRDFLEEEKKEKTLLKENAEKDHRRTYLDLKKQPGFLGIKLPSGNTGRTPFPTKETPPVIKQQLDKTIVEQKQRELDSTQQEAQKKTFSLSTQYIDPQAGETRAHTPAFLTFLESLEASPIKARLKKQTFAAAAKVNDTHKEAPVKDPILEFAEKHWGSSPGRRR